MTLDFSKLKVGIEGENVIEPRKIFTTLNRDGRFRRPSDEQGEVLDAWFSVRTNGDSTIKMNTGSGKTLVGLLALQSSLNEGILPAIYVTADKYLVSQVVQEAKALGVEVTEDENDPRFLSGKAILIINIHKLVNGHSVFGVGSEGVKISVGAVVIDDAHACLVSVEDQFRLKISSSHPIYKDLFSIFRSALEQQSVAGVLEVESADPQRIMPVPYWAWKDNQKKIIKILHDNRTNDDEMKYKWPLLKEVIILCQCVFGGGNLEIAPRYIPIDVIPAFVRAKRRIYMTATLADDGVLVTHFQAKVEAVSKPIRPKDAGSMGDRMILTPQEINPDITAEDIKALVSDIAKTRNVAVIVPSLRRAEFWKDVADQILDRNSISSGIDKMKNGLVGLTVFINKYDGIDLPGNACELLVIDGLPEFYGLIERVEISALEGTEMQLLRQIQRIEQGMGRGVRSSEDRCVVLLLGGQLTRRIHKSSARSMFTPATLVQIDLGREITKQILNEPVDSLRPILDYSFNENPEWQRTSRTVLVNAKEGPQSFIDPTVSRLREAFDFARQGQWLLAKSSIQEAVNLTVNDVEKGYMLQQLAEYTHHINQAESQQILLQAVRLNPQLLKPISGVTYSKVVSSTGTQAFEVSKYIYNNFPQANDLAIFINSMIEDLSWNPDGTKRFEVAFKDLGLFLGFGSQRPEVESGEGPDNLWALGNLQYIIAECKSGAITDFISKSDCDQLSGSVSWFNTKYDKTCRCTPVLIHPSNCFNKKASPLSGTRIINMEHLEILKTNVRNFASAMTMSFNRISDHSFVSEQLDHFNLSAGKFLSISSAGFTKK